MAYTEEDRQGLIEYAKIHLCDMIPYNDPDYKEKLNAMAESYANAEIYPSRLPVDDLQGIIELHDEMLDKGLIDF